MARITFVSFDGAETVVDAVDGEVLMRAALDNGVMGIEAECGGAMMCATCHVYIGDDHLNRVAARCEGQESLLEGAASEVRGGSRLACQIVVGAEHDGLVVHLPESQF